MSRPFVKHILAALNRYTSRLGPQFAAAITYFSILSMVPVLLFAIAVVGWTLTVVRPELWDAAQVAILEAVGEGDAGATIGRVVEEALSQWRTFGFTALLGLAYTGSNWVGNLKRAFRAMWRDKFSEAAEKRNFILELLENLIIFIGLLISVAVAFGMTVLGTGFTENIVSWLGLEHVTGIELLIRGVTIALTFIAGWLLFAFIFIALPGETVDKRGFLGGTLAGALIITLIQQLAGLLFGLFSGNAAAGLFGPIIILMLVFNTLATVILIIAAWVGTTDTYAAELERAERARRTGRTLDLEDGVETLPGVAMAQEQARVEQERASRWAATRSLDSLRAINFDPDELPSPDPDVPVSEATAARGMRVAGKVGYGLGTATGLGVGALLVSLVTRRQ